MGALGPFQGMGVLEPPGNQDGPPAGAGGALAALHGMGLLAPLGNHDGEPLTVTLDPLGLGGGGGFGFGLTGGGGLFTSAIAPVPLAADGLSGCDRSGCNTEALAEPMPNIWLR
jgi:hypothetical protein